VGFFIWAFKMTLRNTLQVEINAIEEDLAQKKAKLAKLESASFLDAGVEEIKAHILSVWGQVFGSAPKPVDAPAAPSAPAEQQP